MYNLTEVGNSVNLFDYFTSLNTSLDYTLGLIMLFVVWLFVFSIMETLSNVDKLLVSSSVTWLISTLLVALEWLAFEYAVVPAVVFFMTLIYKFFVQ